MVTARTSLLSAVFVLAGIGSVSAQSYNPVGPQTGVPIATVTGGDWTECYSAPYSESTGDDLAAIQAACNGGRIMLACAPVGSDTLALLSQTLREQAFQNPGSASSSSHISNGAQWYFDVGGGGGGANSWGFAAVGDSLTAASATSRRARARSCGSAGT